MTEKDITRILAAVRFKFRSDIFANWQKKNPVLLSGEVGVVTDGTESEKVKIGDGFTAWNELGWWRAPQGIPDYVLTEEDKAEIATMVKPIVDQIYNPESPNAQSGKAVSEALTDYVKEADYAIDKEELDAKIGDIETALDNIIAIQNSLIGGDSV